MNPEDTWTKKYSSLSDFNSQQQLTDFTHPFGAQIRNAINQNQITDPHDKQIHEPHVSNNTQDWDPRTMLNNLSFLENKIHHLQDLLHAIVTRKGQTNGRDEILIQHQHLMTADLTPIVVQLISTAVSLLPSHSPEIPISQLAQFRKNEPEQNFSVEMKSDDEPDEGENLPPGSYEILQLEKEEILAPHTHFCTICGKGFKRDANLRMHMRGHGDEYKTRAALAKPHKENAITAQNSTKRYSCPFVGCMRNKDHKKFQPLKTILCVKNHYKRTHCDKRYTCSRCNAKKFSVISDLKTHEKHCGRDKWLCSCGTTFSRKDKLFGHVALFQGHTPAIPVKECKGSVWPSDKFEKLDFDDPSGANACRNFTDLECSGEDPISYFSSLDFDTGGIGGFSELFEDSENSFSFMLSE